LGDSWIDRSISLRFEEPELCVGEILNASENRTIDAVIPIGDKVTVVAAQVAEVLGLRHHSSRGASLARNKLLARRSFFEAGLPVPKFISIPSLADPGVYSKNQSYPCVLKPLGLSASRGVIRADDPQSFEIAFHRIKKLLETPEIRVRRDSEVETILVEDFIEGVEISLEGLMDNGSLRQLALFDKPDPLDGPFFEETLYVTPSRLNRVTQVAVKLSVQKACRTLGLMHGPIHAEVRVNKGGLYVLEVASRPIGGLCSRALQNACGMALEEILLRHALGWPIDWEAMSHKASGVMMIPIPQAGILQRVEGVCEARQLDKVEDVVITAKLRQFLVGPPEGGSYLGFVFSKGDTPEEAEERLRSAHKLLRFTITPGMSTW
jgi:biotin carboxylase